VPGGRGEKAFGTTALFRQNPRVRVLVRGEVEDREEANTRANALVQDMAAIQVLTLSGTFYENVGLLSDPYDAGEDSNRCPIVEFVLDVRKKPSA
jgi:hypothetical protein